MRQAALALAGALWAASGMRAVAAPIEKARTVLRADFETSGPEQVLAPGSLASAVLTTDNAEVAAGRRSLKGDSRASSGEWNEFFHSRQGLFAPKEAYRVSFDYRVLARAENAKFYALFRRAAGGNANEGWKEWLGAPGARGHVELRIAIRRASDYYLIIGIQNRGTLAIDNLVIRTDPANRVPESVTPRPERTWRSRGGVTYYVNALTGSDANPGTSAARAWKTLARVNAGVFAPGDRILLRAGSRWRGYLAPAGSGKEGAPIVLDRYGAGPLPRIDGEGRTLATLYLRNVEQWELNNLEVTNDGGRLREPGRTGVQVQLEDFGTAHHVQLKRLYVHDVNGSLVKSEGGGSGIHCSNGGGKVRSRFDGLLIEGCRLARTDRNGITMSGYWARREWYPSLNVVIRDNRLEDIGGDGIVPIGCDGALVEHNVLRGGRTRCDDFAAGIWPWSCDNTTIQYNEVSGMKGTRDGQGFDSDWNCQNTLFQYNYSHDNDGGFMLICNDGTSKMPWNIGNVGTVIRYNISQNDGARTFQITGPCRDTLIYNNVFFVGKGLDVFAVQAGNWGGAWPASTRFYNNIFHVEGRARFDFGGMTGTAFESNAFVGTFERRPDDPRAVTTSAGLLIPGSGGHGLATLVGYRLRPGSSCLAAGRPIEPNGGRDFFGNPVPTARPPHIGAWQGR